MHITEHANVNVAPLAGVSSLIARISLETNKVCGGVIGSCRDRIDRFWHAQGNLSAFVKVEYLMGTG